MRGPRRGECKRCDSSNGARLEEESGPEPHQGRLKRARVGGAGAIVRGWILRGQTCSAGVGGWGGGTGPDRSCGNSRVGQDGADSSGRK